MRHARRPPPPPALRALRRASVLTAVAAAPLLAQAPAGPPRGTVELAADHHQVTRGIGDWESSAARFTARAGAADVWSGEVLARRAFGDRGVYAAVATTHTFSPTWYGSVGVGGGTGDFLFPALRVDASLSRKWLASRRLVTTATVTSVRSKSVYRDLGAQLGVAAYLGELVVAEAGARVNRSSPGDVTSARGFGAATIGRDRVRVVTLRAASGTEGYQLLAPGLALAHRFHSTEGALAWREWITRSWGVSAQVERYTNPLYTRTGATVAVFRHW